MLDPKFIREHGEEVRKNCQLRQAGADVDAWLEIDERRLVLLQETEGLRAERNQTAEKMKSASADEKEGLMARGKKLKDEIAVKEAALAETDAAWIDMSLKFPNLTDPEAPIGTSDADNKELRQVGEVKKLGAPLDHVALAAKHDLIDFERGAKVAGAKFYYLKGKLVILEQALIRFAIAELMKEGFLPMATPDMARDEIIIGSGYTPRGNETQIYSLENTDLSLIGTSEITVGGYHKDEILPSAKLPLKYAGVSHCFRTEAGAYGRESYGLYRVHQFSKVEMYAFTTPEQSEGMLHELLRIEEHLFKSLEIPYRVVDCCTADLGGPAYRKFDIEAWMWGRGEGKGGWGEVTSVSNCTDFQARRLNIRTKNAQGESVFAHTLNGTGIATSRTMIAVLENHQQPDGTVKIPSVLVPYCGFDTIG